MPGICWWLIGLWILLLIYLYVEALKMSTALLSVIAIIIIECLIIAYLIHFKG